MLLLISYKYINICKSKMLILATNIIDFMIVSTLKIKYIINSESNIFKIKTVINLCNNGIYMLMKV